MFLIISLLCYSHCSSFALLDIKSNHKIVLIIIKRLRQHVISLHDNLRIYKKVTESQYAVENSFLLLV